MLKFSTLWATHPNHTGENLPCRTLGVSNFENQCAIRMGVNLKRAGVAPGALRGCLVCGGAKLTMHAADEMHIIRAKELANALRSASVPGLGATQVLANPKDFANELNGRTGIIFFNGYWWRTVDTVRPTGDHIDLWNGWRTTAKMLLPWFGWLGNYNKSGEIWFWEVR